MCDFTSRLIDEVMEKQVEKLNKMVARVTFLSSQKKTGEDLQQAVDELQTLLIRTESSSILLPSFMI